MSRVDKKPTYAGHSQVILAKWCRAHEDPEVLAAIFSQEEDDAYKAVSLGRVAAYSEIDVSDMVAGLDKTLIHTAVESAKIRKTTMAEYAREAVVVSILGKKQVLWGAAAAVVVASKMLDLGRYAIHYHDIRAAISNGTDLMALSANDAMTRPDYPVAVGQYLAKDQYFITLLGCVTECRKMLRSSTSRKVYEAWSCIRSPRKFPVAAEEVENTAPSDRFLDPENMLLAFFDRVHIMGGLTICTHADSVYVLDKEAKNKARQMVNSAFQSVIYATIMTTCQHAYPKPKLVFAQVKKLFIATANLASSGKSHATVVKSLQKWYMAMFQGMSEKEDSVSAIGGEHAAVLSREAENLWGSVQGWIRGWGAEPNYIVMEMCKLGGIFCADDGVPQVCVDRLKEAQTTTRTADATTRAHFMRFVKAYDFSMEVAHKRSVPKHGGKLVKGTWLQDCLNGKIKLPPERDWGKWWIEAAYDDVDTTPYEWLDAQDVTWIGPYHDRVLRIGNELANAWVNGRNIDGVRNGVDAAEFSLVHGLVLYWATKAEGSKVPAKMRLTASGDAGSRALFSSFEAAERGHSHYMPGFGQNLGPFALAKKMAAIATRSTKASMPIASSHDVKGWSEFEDRGFKDEYLKYEASKFKSTLLSRADQLWHNAHGVFDKLGCKYSAPFSNGGVQGLNGAADTMLHSKIIAYVHHIGIREGILSGGANALTCIDDVTYNPNTREPDLYARVTKVRAHISSVYEKLAYPLDPTKSVYGILKYIYLNDAYVDKALLAAPIRVALKMDSDENVLIRDVSSDVMSYMATASACAVNQAPACVAYLHGTINVCNYLMAFYKNYLPLSMEQRTVWLLGPVGEGCMGVPTFREFMAGADPDRSFTWRDVVVNSPFAKEKHKQAMYALSGHAVMSVGALSTCRDPFTIHHDGPLRGEAVKRALVEKVMRNVDHSSDWDDLEKAGVKCAKKLVEGWVTNSSVVDALLVGDILSTFPDNLYQGAVSRFSNGAALRHLTQSSVIWRIARSTARADRKWMTNAKHVTAMTGYDGFDDVYDMCSELRSLCHPDISVINNVVPSTRAYIAFNGRIDPTAVHHGDWVRINAGQVESAPGRNHITQWGCTHDRSVGTQSTTVTFEDLHRELKANVVGAKLAKAAVLLTTMANLDMHTDAYANAIETAWGVNYALTDLKLTSGDVTAKRVSTVTCKSHCLALAYRNIYSVASASVANIIDFCETQHDHSLANPMAIVHALKLCALNASAWAGLGTSSLATIAWDIRPAVNVKWAYDSHPSTFYADPDLDYEDVSAHIQIFDIPSEEDIVDMCSKVGVTMNTSSHVASIIPSVETVAVYRVDIEKPDVGRLAPVKILKPVRRAVKAGVHAKNLIATSIVRTRLLEFYKSIRVRPEEYIWGEEVSEITYPVSLVDKMVHDAHVVVEGNSHTIGKALSFITRSNHYNGMNSAELHREINDRTTDTVNFVKSAYDGIVGRGEHAFSAAQRSLVVVKDADTYNEKERLKIIKARHFALLKRYGKAVQDCGSAASASKWQGRHAGRACVSYDSSATPRIKRLLVIDFFSKTTHLDRNLVNACVPKQDPLPQSAIADVNDQIMMLYPAYGWQTNIFRDHVTEELKYVNNDCIDIQDRVFALTHSDLHNADHQRPNRWTAAAISAPVERTQDVVNLSDFFAAVQCDGTFGPDAFSGINMEDSSVEEEPEGIV